MTRHTPNARGLSMVEIVATLLIVGVLFSSVGSMMLMSTRTLDSATASVQRSDAERVLAEMTADLRLAKAFVDTSTTGVTAIVPDRNGDGKDETIRYQWDGTPDNPADLTRSVNAGPAAVLLEEVYDLDLGLLSRTVEAQANNTVTPMPNPSGYGFFQTMLGIEKWVVTGNYIGDDVSGRAITGLGFTPAMVIIKGDVSESVNARTDHMPITFELGDQGFNSSITSLDEDGFTITRDAEVNKKGKVYHWVAFKAIDSLSATGTYTGDNIDGREIAVGFQPAYVILIPEVARSAHHRPASLSGDATLAFGLPGVQSNMIEALTGNGFRVGDDKDVNDGGKTYYWFAVAETAGKLKTGWYSGNGALSRSITGQGMKPAFVIIGNNINAVPPVLRFDTNITGDGYQFLDAGIYKHGILSMSDGQFSVGDGAEVNTSGNKYYYITFAP